MDYINKKYMKICIIGMFLLLSGCSQKKNHLVLEGESIKNNFIKIYQLDEKSSLYSVFPENKYQVGDEMIDLKKALENKKITIKDIVDQIEYENSLNDGGTTVYKNKNKKISSNDFYFVACHAYKDNMTGYIEDYYIVNDYTRSDICNE